MHLAELALDFARTWLKPDGALLVKVFHGHGFDDFLDGDAQDVQGGVPRASRMPRVIAARKSIFWAEP
jgi:23S rRNA (uridine2552-2'-O)-methyltransferase